MNNKLFLSKNKLNIFHEGRKRRIFVAKLAYSERTDRYNLTYDEAYTLSKTAIPIGPELSLFRLHHKSEKGKLFPSLLDRIPSRDNPAYKDYCEVQGISIEEKNPIILLASIGSRGPSSFIFERIYYSAFKTSDIRKLRNEIGITQHDLSAALDISWVTLQRIEAGTSHDLNTLKIIEIFFTFPEVALWQLKQTGGRLHSDVLSKLTQFFKKLPYDSIVKF